MRQKARKTIPLKFSPAFFITAAIIGFINSYSIVGTVIWIGIILVSVLVHEYGHALASKFFGQNPRIELVAFGGVTIPEGKKLYPWQEFLVVLMGPLFGFGLFLGAFFVARMGVLPPLAQQIVAILALVNLFWTLINLLPILPLDGGQLVRIALSKVIGSRALKATLMVSIVLGLVAGIFFFIIGQLFVGAIFLLLTFQNIETLRRFHNYSEADGNEGIRGELKEIEALLSRGEEKRATEMLTHLIEETKNGLIHTIACEYLAKVLYQQKQYQEAYNALIKVQNQISKEAKCILFLSAYEIKDFEKVIDLSGECFTARQTLDVALRAAASHAAKQDLQSALEWLQTAKSFGSADLAQLVQDPAFDPIRNEERFKKLVFSSD